MGATGWQRAGALPSAGEAGVIMARTSQGDPRSSASANLVLLVLSRDGRRAERVLKLEARPIGSMDYRQMAVDHLAWDAAKHRAAVTASTETSGSIPSL